MNIIDLFSGIGGLSYGFKKIGCDIVLANELDKDISNSYSLNHPETKMINLPIQELLPHLISQNININNINGVVGGPPCQGFSAAGKRHRKNFIDDPRNYLFRDYINVIKHFDPDFFVMENVPGFLTMNNGEIFEEVSNTFSDSEIFKNGIYHLSYAVVNAYDVGVPQTRKRLIVCGTKKPAFNLKEKISEYILQNNINKTTVWDAISDLDYLDIDEGSDTSEYILPAYSDFQKKLRNDNNLLYGHKAFTHKPEIIERIKKIKPGENFKVLDENIKSVHSGAYGRLSWDKPATTITTRFDTPSTGRVIHPRLNRVLTPREAARIQSFPDSFAFYGNKSIICKQIGNAVPPLLSECIANIILKHLSDNA